MDNRQTVLEITPKNEIIRIARGRQTVIAKLSEDNKTLTWKDATIQATYRKSVDSFLEADGITIETVLLDGQAADVVPAGAPTPPKLNKMQGELTPKYLEWLMKYKPIAFQNLMGVILRELKPDEKKPVDPRELWQSAKVKRTDTRPNPDSQGGEMIATKFTMEDQIIARRASHLTFTPKEIYRGDTAAEQAEPYDDPHHPATLHKLAAQGKAEILSVGAAAASSGAQF